MDKAAQMAAGFGLYSPKATAWGGGGGAGCSKRVSDPFEGREIECCCCCCCCCKNQCKSSTSLVMPGCQFLTAQPQQCCSHTTLPWTQYTCAPGLLKLLAPTSPPQVTRRHTHKGFKASTLILLSFPLLSLQCVPPPSPRPSTHHVHVFTCSVAHSAASR